MKRIGLITFFLFFAICFSVMPSLSTSRNLRVGVYNFEPLVFTDEQRQADGLYIDVLNHIAEKEHWNIEYVSGTWQECLNRLERGDIDLLPSIAYSEERAKKFDFSKEFLFLDWGIVYRQRGGKIETVFDLQGKKVSALKGSIYTQGFRNMLEQFGINCMIVEKDEYTQVFESVHNKETDAGINTNVYGLRLEARYDIEKTSILFSPIKIRFAVKKDRPDTVINILDDYLTNFKADRNSVYYEFYDKWMEFYHPKDYFPKWVWGVGIAVIGIAILCFLFIVILKRQVRLKISELASANELLKHSEEHFRLAFENAYIGVCLVSTDGRILSVNQRMCEIFGYSKQEFEGMSVNTITHPDYRDISPTFIKKAASGEIAHAEFEKQYIHKQGNIIWGKVSSSIIRDNQGKPLYFISYVQDITDRKLIEEVQSFLLRYDYLAAGETFFRSLARYLAEKLEADFVCIDRLEDSNLSARTVAVWHDGKFEDNVTYTLKDTPCGDVVGKTICSYPEGVCYLFPKDEVLQQMNAESYVGTTLWSSEGQPIGLIALIWRNPITNQQIAETILKLVAVRAAGELERKQAEDVLRKNEKKLSKVFQTSPAIITITTISEGRFLEVNKAFLNLFGYTRQEVIGKTSSELNLWEDITIRNNAVASLYAQKKDLLFEAAFRKKNTDLFYGLISLTPIEMNGVDCILSTGVDITDRKQAEEQFRTIFDMALDMICVADLDRAAFTKINPAFTHTLGYSEKELTDRSFLDFVHPDDVEKTMAVIRSELKKGADIISFENRYRCKDGSYRYLIWNSHPIPEKNVTFAVAHDITDRKKAEEALRESIREYSALFENMISGFAYHQMIFDENNKPTDYIFLEINRAFEKHTGLTRDIIGKRVTEIHPGIEKHDPDFIAIYGEVALSGKPVRFDVYFVLQQHWYTISAYSPKKGYFAAVFDDITERRNAEKELREKSEELTTVLDVLPALVWIAHDPECGVITGNRAVSELFGISEGTNVSQTAAESGKALRIRHLTADGTKLRAEELPMQRAIALGQPVLNQEFTYDLSDGRQIPALGNAVPLFDENGKVRGAVGAFWDITERRRAEEALKRSEERYRNAQTLGKVGNWEYNIRTAYFWGSDEAKRIYGFAPDSEHFTTEEVENCIPERERVHQALLDLIEKDAEYNLEFDIVTYNTGERKTIISIAQLERDSNGNPLKITGVIHDITDRKQMENILKESEEKFYKAFHSSPALMTISTLEEGIFLDANTRFLKVSEFAREEVIGRKSSDIGLWQTEQRQKILSVLKDEGFVHNMEVELTTKSGKIIPLLWFGDIIQIQNKPCLIVTGYDLTERRQAEAEKAKLESRLRQAQSMEAIGTLAGGIAHDFNNILFPIMGYTEMTMDDLPKNSIAYQNLGEVLKAALRAKELVNQILTFSRQRENEKMILKIQPVVKEALKLIRSTLPTTIELSQKIDPNCNPVMADPTQIHQIIMNLCTNAYHAMQDHGGVLEVILTEVKLGADDLRAYPGSLPGTYLKLSVSDTGIGMAKEMLERIFDPFFTTKPVGKGTGLGLSVVHGIVKQMGGHVRVYSEPGKGTAFHVYMPVLETESISDQKPAVSDEFIPTGSERILLTDDEVPILNMLGQMLEELGYRVSSYADSSDAFNAFEKMPDSFDLLITDMTMPNMTGAQLAKKILEIRADMPIILCTGFSEQINGAKSEKFGIKGYLMKPVIRSEMAKMIRKVLGKVRNEKASGTRNQ